MIELSVILPVHNEEEIIKQVFSQIHKTVKKHVKSSEFILVENGSTDKSLKVLKGIDKEFTNTRHSIAPKGYGSAVLKGLSIAKGKYVCYMPSDGQIDVKVFPRLWTLVKIGKWQLIKIKRINRESFSRLLISKVFSAIISLLFQTPLIDVNGSPRIFEKKYMGKLNLKSKDSFIDAEFLIKISKLNWKIKEVPTKTISRTGGKSTRTFKTFVEFLMNIYRFKFVSNS